MGGATGLVGDPSGRKLEREPADAQQVESNINSISAAVRKFFTRALQYAQRRAPAGITLEVTPPILQSNITWHQGFGMLEFLRTVGIHARVNAMISRDRHVTDFSGSSQRMLTHS